MIVYLQIKIINSVGVCLTAFPIAEGSDQGCKSER